MNRSRRRFLATAGASLALPWLSSLERHARATTSATKARFVAIYAPNGMHMPAWTPQQTGTDFTLPPILRPLASIREDVDIVSGLYNKAADLETAGHHASGTAGFLTGRRAFRSESRLELGVSLDGLIDPHPLAVGLEDGQSYGDCDNGFSCAYSRNISWTDAQTPRSKLVSPRAVFDTLFAGFDPSASAIEQQRRQIRRTSVLDAVRAQTHALERDLGHDDSMVLEAYLDDVRDLERRVTMGQPTCHASLPTEPLDVEEHAATMIELIVTALRCDTTRAVTLMLDNSASNRVYTSLGVMHGHHELSHIAGSVGRTEDLEAVGAWQVGWFARLVERLRDLEEGEVSVLDSTLVLFSSELSDGNMHSHEDLPALLGGGRALGREPGRHLSLQGSDWGDFLLSIGRRVGLELDTFGEYGTQPIPAI